MLRGYDESSLDTVNGSVLHRFPCHINYEGPVEEVESHLYITKDTEDPSKLETSLRGRRMVGRLMNLPSDIKGIVLDRNKLTVRMEFGHVISWEADELSGKSDDLPRKALELARTYKKLL